MMIKTKINRCVALLMAFLMFFTSTGISMDMHICQNHLKSISFFGKAKDCYELMGDTSGKKCNHHPKPCQERDYVALDKPSCCKGAFHYFQSDGERIFSNGNYTNRSIVNSIISVAIPLLDTLQKDSTLNTFEYKNYKPPLLYRDIPILIQSFLI